MSFSPFRLGGRFSIKTVRKSYLQCQCGDHFAVFDKTLFSCRGKYREVPFVCQLFLSNHYLLKYRINEKKETLSYMKKQIIDQFVPQITRPAQRREPIGLKITGMNPQASFGNISQQATGYCTLRFAGLFNLPIPTCDLA